MKALNLNTVLVSSLIIVLTLNSSAAAQTDSDAEMSWPLEYISEEGILTIYQPQLDSLEKNTINARSAVSVKLSEESEPIFGAVWFTSRLLTDREKRMAVLENIKVKQVRFPEADDDKLKILTSIVEKSLPSQNIEISLDRIHAMLELAKKEEAVSKEFILTPPEIIFATSPTVLVSIDGTPRLKQVKGKKLMQVINTAYTILLDTETKKYYLGSGENWMSSTEIMGTWSPAAEIPDAIKNFDEGEKETAEELVARDGADPKVIIVTNTAELVVIEGESEFIPIRGTDLLYVENTEAN